jgi:recombination protein RecT
MATTLKAAVTGNASTAVATQQTEHKTIAHLLTDPKIKAQMQLALPKHMTADRLARIALTEIRKTPKLAQCDQASFLGAIMQCAALGLEPGGTLGHCYMIPFENRRADRTEVQFIIGYRGMIDLARRSGQIISLTARAVREHDEFSYRYGLDETVVHIPANGERGEITHFYAVAKLRDGGVQFEVMSRADVEKVRDGSQGYKTAMRYAKPGQAPNTPWVEHFEPMGLKTVTRRLFKWLPVSIEMQTAIVNDERADAGLSQDNPLLIEGSYQVAPQHDEQEGAPLVATGPDITAQDIRDALKAATDRDQLDAAADLVSLLPEPERQPLLDLWNARCSEIAA